MNRPGLRGGSDKPRPIQKVTGSARCCVAIARWSTRESSRRSPVVPLRPDRFATERCASTDWDCVREFDEGNRRLGFVERLGFGP
jgi:hypothetical protein